MANTIAPSVGEATRQQWRPIDDQPRLTLPRFATLSDEAEPDVLA